MFTNFEIMLKQQRNTVRFFFLSKTITLKRRKELKLFITQFVEKEGHKVGAINYVFCSDKYLLDINRKYLGHDYYTDVITFLLSEKKQPLEGEIYISVDRVKDNALTLREKPIVELHRVIFHGALHLCGYKDKNKKEFGIMKKRENLWLRRYFEFHGAQFH